MKILVDARELGDRPTGVGRYLMQLLRRWSSRADTAAREIVLVAPAVSAPVRALGFRAIETRGPGGTVWEQFRLPKVVRAESPDVVFCPAYTSPYWTSAPVVVTIHDISFTAHPEWFSTREGLRRRVLTKASAEHASAVITVSAFSAREIELHYGVPSTRIHVIRHGISHLPRRSGVPRERLVLYVGSLFNRRHVPALVAAVASLVPEIPDLRLAVVGENRTYPRQDPAAQANQLGIGRAVEFADYADDSALANLYARARAFVFVSEYEGFGLTPLEALAAGVPPIVADTDVSRETCGDAALYVAPGDVDALANAIRSVMTDEAVRARLLEAGASILPRYSWDQAADRTLELLEQVGRR